MQLNPYRKQFTTTWVFLLLVQCHWRLRKGSKYCERPYVTYRLSFFYVTLNLSNLLVAKVACMYVCVCVYICVCAVGRLGDREFRRLLWGSGVQIAPHSPHWVSSLTHKSPTKPSSNQRRPVSSTFHLSFLLCCCLAGLIYSSVTQDRKRRGGEGVRLIA